MQTVIGDAQLEFLEDLRSYLDDLDPDLVEATRRENIEDPMQPREHGRRFLRRLAADGRLGVSWPTEHGGQGRSELEHWLFAEELYSRRLPNGLLTLNVVGPTLALMGDEAQRAEYLPQILAGDIVFAIGYSEPDAGSDLAALRTRAVRSGDEYIVNGQKMWTTGGSVATHYWLAARTGAPEDRHRGISVFIVPMDAPGITVTPIITQGGERTTAVFLDDVRIPVSQRIGGENEGWAAVVCALNFERMFFHNEPRWELRQLADWAAAADLLEGDTAAAHSLQETIGEHAVDVEICRLFALRGASMLTEGVVPMAEASANKIWWGELRQRICDTGLDHIGVTGTIAHGSPHAPAHGHLEHGLQSSPVWRFGGGTNEIQLDIIAEQRLGMPR
ncbi:acyl-CoA dehydrogenase family protein [Microbacterium sp.]|uniref:acyl-CoA dehydrogenase family protein n=1 Tax=Microbacterium sp. TaxID=51671 RepID=UPI0037C74E40